MSLELSGILRKLRNDRGLTLRQVESATGISNSYLNQMESGIKEPSPKKLWILSIAYKYSYSALMKATGYAYEDPKCTCAYDKEHVRKKLQSIIDNLKV